MHFDTNLRFEIGRKLENSFVLKLSFLSLGSRAAHFKLFGTVAVSSEILVILVITGNKHFNTLITLQFSAINS